MQKITVGIGNYPSPFPSCHWYQPINVYHVLFAAWCQAQQVKELGLELMTNKLQTIVPPKNDIFSSSKMQISSKILPKIPNVAIFRYPKIRPFK